MDIKTYKEKVKILTKEKKEIETQLEKLEKWHQSYLQVRLSPLVGRCYKKVSTQDDSEGKYFMISDVPQVNTKNFLDFNPYQLPAYIVENGEIFKDFIFSTVCQAEDVVETMNTNFVEITRGEFLRKIYETILQETEKNKP